MSEHKRNAQEPGNNEEVSQSVRQQEAVSSQERRQSQELQQNNNQQRSSQQNQSPYDEPKNSPQPQHSEQSQNSQNEEEEQDKSDNVDNKSEGDDEQQESNIKSDERDEDEDRSGQDIKKEQPSGKKCFNKLCNSKKIYKKLRSKVQHAKYRFLCRPCYENYCNNDFCEFCQQIYSSTGNSDDDDQWIGCDSCNRWNHVECQKKYRNKNIHEIKDEDTPYLCLTCSYKFKEKTGGNDAKRTIKKEYPAFEDPKPLKQKLQISKDQRVQIFNKKIESLPSLEYFLQNYNFRLWINENLIKDDLETLRQASKRNSEEGKKSFNNGNKKVKVQ